MEISGRSSGDAANLGNPSSTPERNDAVAEGIPEEPVRRLAWIGMADTGDGTLSERAEEILEDEWS